MAGPRSRQGRSQLMLRAKLNKLKHNSEARKETNLSLELSTKGELPRSMVELEPSK